MTKFPDLNALKGQLGLEIATTPWMRIDQSRINQFAEATNDHQWIHTDPVKAAKGPFGGPIAHGFLTLSLIPALLSSSMSIENQRMGVNYGLNKVRFPSPVPVGSEVQARIVLKSFDAIGDDGAQCVYEITITRRDSDKPVCVAEAVTRHYV